MGRRLLIPGTGGCIYTRSDGGQVGSILDLALDHHFHLECEYPDDENVLDPVRTSGLKDRSGAFVSLDATGYIRGVYKVFDDSDRPTYRVWPYDWRLDIRRSGRELVKFFRAEEARGDKWDIVCHSQGGLILIAAAMSAGNASFAKWVRRVAFVGVPIFGTINAASALLNGVDLLPGVTVSVPVVRTWPAVYMMLPRWWTGLSSSPSRELLLNTTWARAGLLAAEAPARLNLSTGVDRRLLARARAWQRALARYDFGAFRTLERFSILQGKNHPTRVKVPGFPTLPRLQQNGNTVDRGDSLVPADLTYRMLPGPVRAVADTFYTNVRSHMLFCSQIQTLQLCESLFQ